MEKISRFIDHAVLKPEMTVKEAAEAIELGVKHNVLTVCVRPSDIALARSICSGTDTSVITVAAFPFGYSSPESKRLETALYINAGASEIDMVANYGFVRSKLWNLVEQDIAAVVSSASPAGVPVKVILETSQLDDDAIRGAVAAAINAGASFVKTSTGFYGGGASAEAVGVMLDAAAGRIAVKASGGIRSYDQARQFLNMGVARIGAGYSSVPALCAAESENG